MELRDTFAIEAMKVMMKRAYDKPLTLAQADELRRIIPIGAYEYADAMMGARGRLGSEEGGGV